MYLTSKWILSSIITRQPRWNPSQRPCCQKLEGFVQLKNRITCNISSDTKRIAFAKWACRYNNTPSNHTATNGRATASETPFRIRLAATLPSFLVIYHPKRDYESSNKPTRSANKISLIAPPTVDWKALLRQQLRSHKSAPTYLVR